jgi:hypothetical protein
MPLLVNEYANARNSSKLTGKRTKTGVQTPICQRTMNICVRTCALWQKHVERKLHKPVIKTSAWGAITSKKDRSCERSFVTIVMNTVDDLTQLSY